MTRPTVVLVCGGRDYATTTNRAKVAERNHVYRTLDDIKKHYGKVLIVAGGAPGADKCAEQWAEDREVHCAVVRALWNKHGSGAGTRRNTAMLALSPDICVAFPGGVGTGNMVQQARAAGIPTYEIK